MAQRNEIAIVLPARFWVFAAFALLYGICETMLIALVMAALSFVVVRRQTAPELGCHYEPT